jgi:hypothetical protein
VQDIYKPSSSHLIETGQQSAGVKSLTHVQPLCSRRVLRSWYCISCVSPRTVPEINKTPVNLGGRFVRNVDQACLRVRLSKRTILSEFPSRAFTSPRPKLITKANLLSREDVLDSAEGAEGVLASIYYSVRNFCPSFCKFGLGYGLSSPRLQV